MRKDNDLLGEVEIPDGALWGAQTERARQHFAVSGRPVNPALIRAGAEVKKACALANAELGFLPRPLAAAIVTACDEIIAGRWADQFVTDALQGGAGTSTNMNWNEVIASRASVLSGEPVSPHDHVNLHQSTNDVYPTALRVAALRALADLEPSLIQLLEACEGKEREFSGVIKLGRTELRDAVPITLGREFGAWATALGRDRWRIAKCAERLRETNLGGTVIGTGMAAPRAYIFLVIEKLRDVTRLTLSRAENLVDATQNLDPFAEVSGILRAHAVTLSKMARDLRFMGSGPMGGLGEIELPALQPGSSMMPGKVNPVMPEMVQQVAYRVMAHDQELVQAAMHGELELNAFLPLIADALLDSLQLLERTDRLFAETCVKGIKAYPERCRALMESSREVVTALIPRLGHERAVELARDMAATGKSVREAVLERGWMTAAELDEALTAERLCQLGWRKP
ncbi:MAG: aspartate ammonia-lyase [Kiritimatiellia bacterium]